LPDPNIDMPRTRHGQLVVFVIGLTPADYADPPTPLRNEAAKYNDIVFVSMAKRHPWSLLEKTLGFFQFAAGCGAKFTVKTNEHSFVRVDKIAELIQSGGCGGRVECARPAVAEFGVGTELHPSRRDQ